MTLYLLNIIYVLFYHDFLFTFVYQWTIHTEFNSVVLFTILYSRFQHYPKDMFTAQPTILDCNLTLGWFSSVCLVPTILPCGHSTQVFSYGRGILHFYKIKFHIFKCKIHFYEEKCIYLPHENSKSPSHQPRFKDLFPEFMFIHKKNELFPCYCA